MRKSSEDNAITARKETADACAANPERKMDVVTAKRGWGRGVAEFVFSVSQLNCKASTTLNVITEF